MVKNPDFKQLNWLITAKIVFQECESWIINEKNDT